MTSTSPNPIIGLSALLDDISQVMPVHILPGENDPAGTLLPQQPFPRAMFGEISNLASLHCETNPSYLRVRCDEGASIARTLLINSGQPLNDLFKYLPSPPNTRLDVLESTLRWRHMAPTAPDTLWCHPYFTKDPFLLTATPDIYIVGCQKQFGTRLVEHEKKAHGAQRCRLVMVPEFSKTGVLVLVNIRTLDVKTVCFGAEGADENADAELCECFSITLYTTLNTACYRCPGSFALRGTTRKCCRIVACTGYGFTIDVQLAVSFLATLSQKM
jgi:DNA polymerase delta subunit 2